MKKIGIPTISSVILKTLLVVTILTFDPCEILAIPNDSTTQNLVGTLQRVYGDKIDPQTRRLTGTGITDYYLKDHMRKLHHLDLGQLDDKQKWQKLVGKYVELEVTKQKTTSKSNRSSATLRSSAGRLDVVNIRPAQRITSQHLSLGAEALVEEDAKKPWVNILCKFADNSSEPVNTEFVQDMFANSYPFLEHYWKQTTYGKVDIAESKTIGWFNLPHNRAYYVPIVDGEENADLNSLETDCRNAAQNAYDESQYYGTNLYFNDRLDGPAWGGGGTTWLPPWAHDDIGVVAHEMGHAYGLSHSSGSYGNEYDSPWDVMSNAFIGSQHPPYYFIPQHTIAFHKFLLGAIDESYIWDSARYDAQHWQTIHLTRLEELPTGSNNYSLVNIKSQDSRTHYTLEARDLIDYDSSLPGKAIIIHKIENEHRAYVIDPDDNGDVGDEGAQWLPGERFSDAEGNILIEVLEETTTGFNIRITAPRTIPGHVSDIDASDDLEDKINVSWSAVTGADYYKVYRCDTWEAASCTQSFQTDSDATTYDDTSAIPLEYYYYRVKACNSEGCSDFNNYTYDFGKRISVPLQVINVDASDDLENKITISWTSASGAQYYNIYRCSTQEKTSCTQVSHNIYNETTYADTSAIPLEYYYYRVKACNSEGCSDFDDYDLGRRISVPEQVTNVDASDDLKEKISVSWSAVTGADYYKVYRCDTWEAASCTQSFQADSDATTYDDTSAVPLEYYYYRVKACNSEGCADFNNYSYDWGMCLRAEVGTNYHLLITVIGDGTISSNPTGQICANDCSNHYSQGAFVTLNASPAIGWSYIWSGDCSGKGLCAVMMDQNRTVTATFVPMPPASKIAINPIFLLLLNGGSPTQ